MAVSGVQGCRRVARAVTARSRELGISQQDLAMAAGVSTATVRKLQRGGVHRYRRQTLAAVAAALRWPPDALDRIHAGEDVDAVGVVTDIDGEGDGDGGADRLAGLVSRLPRHERNAVERLVQELLRGQGLLR